MPQKATTLTDQQLDEVIARQERMLVDRPNDIGLVINLLTLLDCQIPRTDGQGAYTQCQSALSSKFKTSGVTGKHLDTNFLINSINEYREIISQYAINRRVAIKQIYEGKRHVIHGKIAFCSKYLSFFEETQVICGMCYNCYKVQIAPSNLIDLIRLSLILKIIELDRDNPRKCMIEMRDGINNPYKGYIYCQSEEEAISCLHTLQLTLERFGLSHITCGLSHGCSEYGLKYPEFKFSPDGVHRAQKQSDAWSKIEEDYFSTPFSDERQIMNFNTSEITLREVICFETWIKYSEIIGDGSHKRFAPMPADGKLRGFVDRVAKQAHIRKAQLSELRARQLG